MILRVRFHHLTYFKKVHLLRLSSGGSELVCEGLFSHPDEIWDLASCPFDQRIFSTVFSTGKFADLELISKKLDFLSFVFVIFYWLEA